MIGETTSAGRTRIRFAYPTCYERDGVLDTVDSAYADQWASGLGSAAFLGRLRNSSSIAGLVGEPANKQYTVLTASFGFKNFSRVLDFDPDVSISLLFEADTPFDSPIEASLPVVGIAIGVSVGAVVLVGLLVLIAVPSVRNKVFPFTRPEDSPESTSTLIEETPSRAEASGKWAPVRPSSSSVTNAN